EEGERRGPRAPRKAVVTRRLHDEQRGLCEPAESDAPGRRTAGSARMPRVAEVADSRLSVEEQCRPEEQLSQRARAPAALLRLARRVHAPRAGSLRARAAAASVP